MLKMSHTNERNAHLADKDGYDVVSIYRVMPELLTSHAHRKHCLTDQQWQAEVNLIAAIPDMVAALEALIDPIPDDEIAGCPQYEQARAALAKAKGEA